MEEKIVSFECKARYYQYGNIDTPKELWFVLHGHGQLAQFFIRNFKILNPDDYCIIAPEGLSRYYLSGFTGKVGATWMTKEGRLTDIENYINYLNSVYLTVLNHANQDIKVTAFGFSQGTATVSRWVAQSSLRFDKLILWSGIFPPDMNIASAQERFKQIEILNVYGDDDEFLKNEKLIEQKKIISELGIDAKEIQFKGAHCIDKSTLADLVTNSY